MSLIPNLVEVKGNKKKAEEMLSELRRPFVIPKSSEDIPLDTSMDFASFMMEWLSFAEHTIARTTYASYQNMVVKKIVPYFREHPVT